MSIVPHQPSPEQPTDPLSAAIVQWVGAGWQVESRTATQAVLVTAKSINHVLHGMLLLGNLIIGGTCAVCLSWTIVVPVVWLLSLIAQGIVWAVMAQKKEARKVLTLDSYGRVNVS